MSARRDDRPRRFDPVLGGTPPPSIAGPVLSRRPIGADAASQRPLDRTGEPSRQRITLAIALAVVPAAFVACDRRTRIATCDDDLRGVFVNGSERWMVLDNGATLEAYPLFPDGSIAGEVVVAPRVIDLERGARPGDSRPGDSRAPESRPPESRPGERASGAMLRGSLHQRFMRRAERCEASVPVEVTRCAGDTIELVLADPSPPIGFAPCAWAQAGPSRIVRWQRE